MTVCHEEESILMASFVDCLSKVSRQSANVKYNNIYNTCL